MQLAIGTADRWPACLGMAAPAWAAGDDPRSTNIAFDRTERLLFVANRDADSLSVFKVSKGGSEI